LLIIAAIGVIAYFILYNGTSGYTPSGGSGGGGAGGGGYVFLAVSAEQVRRVAARLRGTRTDIPESG
jgi:hypothetical protein